MRKSILVMALLLVSATAQAGATRGLSTPQNQPLEKPFRQAEVTVLPAPDEVKPLTQPAAEPTKPVEIQPAEQAKPSVADQPKAAGEIKPEVRPADTKPAEVKAVAKVERKAQAKPRKKRMTTEARIRYELGRHGITW